MEDIWPDTLRPETGKHFNNFICYDNQILECFKAADRRNQWKDNNKACEKEVENLIKYMAKPKGGVQFFFNEEVSLSEITLSDKVKPSVDYIYRVRDWDKTFMNCDTYTTFKDAVQTILKKIKNKYCVVRYHGLREKIECTENEISNILARMSNDTESLHVTQMDKNEEESDGITITIYKNCMKS